MSVPIFPGSIYALRCNDGIAGGVDRDFDMIRFTVPVFTLPGNPAVFFQNYMLAVGHHIGRIQFQVPPDTVDPPLQWYAGYPYGQAVFAYRPRFPPFQYARLNGSFQGRSVGQGACEMREILVFLDTKIPSPPPP